MSFNHRQTSFGICSCSLVLLCFVINVTTAQFNDPAVFYTMVELVCLNGYPVQEHKVITEDGYILTLHRIPNAKRRPKIYPKAKHYQYLHRKYHPDFAHCVNESMYETPTGSPILMAHGLFSSSDNFVLQGPKSDLAYLLVDAGHDVWFTNVRGNFYSRSHVKMNPSDFKFWDYSFHEMGMFDLPAFIDYILKVTGYDQLIYIGHSMGTTMFFVMGATKPEYNNKIKLFVGLTPVSEIKQANFSPSKAQAFSAGYKLVQELKRQKVFELLPRSPIQGIFSRSFCAKGSPLQNFCYDAFFSFTGYHSKLFLRKKLPMFLSHGLSGSSAKTIDHFQQFFENPFRYFNYGSEENWQRYGSEDPPTYNYSNIIAPVALFYSKGDYIVASQDVQILIDNLPNVVDAQLLSKYSHVDYLWAYNAKDLVYKRILLLVQRFENYGANNSLYGRQNWKDFEVL